MIALRASLMGGRLGRPLVLPGLIVPPLGVSRAQAGGARATRQGALGVRWDEFGADAPRFSGARRRLLVENQRTNTVRNPRAEGSPPTHWVASPAGGLSTTFIGSGVADGIDFATYEVSGTPSATTGTTITFDTSIAASAGQEWSGAAFVGLDPGFGNDISGMNWSHRLLGATDTSGVEFTPTTAPLATQRVGSTRTMPASTTTVQPRIRYAGSVGVPVSFRLRMGWPTCELAAFPTTPVLPAVGTPAAATRGADVVTAALASLGIGAAGACTVLMAFVIGQLSSVTQTIMQIDDGTSANRWILRVDGGTSSARFFRVLGGASALTIIGALVPGAVMRVGLSLDGLGGGSAVLDAGAVGTLTGGPTSGLTTLRLGSETALSVMLAGEIGTVLCQAGGVSGGQLQRLVAEMPI